MNKLIWVITDLEDGEPIIVSTSKEEAQEQLFDYMGYDPVNLRDDVKFLGFFKIEYSEHEDDFIGFYSFESKYPIGTGDNVRYDWEVQQFNLFCKELNKKQK